MRLTAHKTHTRAQTHAQTHKTLDFYAFGPHNVQKQVHARTHAHTHTRYSIGCRARNLIGQQDLVTYPAGQNINKNIILF